MKRTSLFVAPMLRFARHVVRKIRRRDNSEGHLPRREHSSAWPSLSKRDEAPKRTSGPVRGMTIENITEYYGTK